MRAGATEFGAPLWTAGTRHEIDRCEPMRDQARKIYLERAAECERRAHLATDEVTRSTYREAARLWLYIDEQAELFARRTRRQTNAEPGTTKLEPAELIERATAKKPPAPSIRRPSPRSRKAETG
jgi:hypothetical protein